MKHFPRSLLFVGLSAVVVFSSGCAATRLANTVEERVVPKTTEYYEGMRQVTQESNSFQVRSGFFAAKTPLRTQTIEETVRLSPLFSQSFSLDTKGKNPGLQEILDSIYDLTNVSVFIQPDASEYLASQTETVTNPNAQNVPVGGPSASGAAPIPTEALPSAPPPGLADYSNALPSLEGVGGVSPESLVSSARTRTENAPRDAGSPPGVEKKGLGLSDLTLPGLKYDGNLRGFLDYLTRRLGLFWRWDGAQVKLFRMETRLFRMDSLPGTSEVSANLNTSANSSSGGGGGGTSGNSGQTISSNTSLAIWEDVEASIEALLSTDGELSMIPSAGMISVRDTPVALDIISRTIDELNSVYSRQVMLHVEVYSVEQRSADNYGIDWGVFWQQASSRYGFNYFSSGSGGGNPAVATGPVFTVNFNDPTSPFNGSNGLFTVLSDLGKTQLLNSATAISLNGQAVPVNVVREQAYLKEYSSTIEGAGTTGRITTTLTPDVISEGFSLNFLPRILPNNNIVMRYAIDLATTEGIETFETPDGLSAIQLPQRSLQNFLQNVTIRSGETLVLTGVNQARTSQTSNGPGSASAWFLGGRKTADVSNRTIVVAVTPTVINNNIR